MKVLFIALVLFGVLFSSGCQTGAATPSRQPTDSALPTEQLDPQPTDSAPSTKQPNSQTPVAATPDRSERLTPAPTDQAGALPEKVAPAETTAPVLGEVAQELMNAILGDAAKRSGVPAEQISVVRAESRTWNDGSLGCPKPGVMYTQALVPGYWVVLQAGGKEYDYRAAETGHFVLCESGTMPVEPVGTPAQ